MERHTMDDAEYIIDVDMSETSWVYLWRVDCTHDSCDKQIDVCPDITYVGSISTATLARIILTRGHEGDITSAQDNLSPAAACVRRTALAMAGLT